MPDLWMDVDAALAEVPVNLFPLIDDTDFKTRETGIVYNQAGMDLVWNFVTPAGAATQTTVTPTTGGDYDWAHLGDGMYTIEIPASGGASINNDTEGFGWFTGFCTGVLPWRGPVIGFRAAGLNNALVESAWSATRGLAGTALPNAAADAAGGLPISDAGGLDLDTQIGTDIDAILTDTAEIGTAGAGLTDLGGMSTGMKAEVEAEVTDALEADGLDHLVSASVAGADVADNSIIAKMVGDDATADWDSFNNTTDSLEALRNHIGDGTNLTEAGGTGDHLTAIDLPNQTMDITGDITGNLSGSVGSVTGAVGSVTGHTAQTADHTANIAAILNDTDVIDDGTSGLVKIAADVAAVLVDTGTDGVVLADYALAAGKIGTDAITSAKIADYAILAANIGTDAITAAKIADAAIDAAALAADMDTYQADVELIDDDGGSNDRYSVTFLKNGETITTGITSPTIQVIKDSDGTDLVSSTALTQVGALGHYKHNEGTSRITAGAVYKVKVQATIGGSTRSWQRSVGRDT